MATRRYCRPETTPRRGVPPCPDLLSPRACAGGPAAPGLPRGGNAASGGHAAPAVARVHDAGQRGAAHRPDGGAVDLHRVARCLPAQDAGLDLGRVLALPVAARRLRPAAPAQLRRHRRGHRAGDLPQLLRLRRRPSGAAADAVGDRRLPRGRSARHRQPPDQRPGHHELEPYARPPLPRDGDHAGRRHPRVAALRRPRTSPHGDPSRAVAVLRRERALPQSAPGVRGPGPGRLPGRAHHRGALAAGFRAVAGADAHRTTAPSPGPHWS
ncbi:MAG: hypothetical protein JWO98_515 [Frankiales bacterium]|nr:hypothetical protein [Frankiales bacterium]